MFRVEAHLWEYHSIRATRGEGCELGEGFAKDSPTFMRLQRRNEALERSYRDAWAELERARADAPPSLAGPQETAPVCPPPRPIRPAQPAPNTAQTKKSGSFLQHPPQPSSLPARLESSAGPAVSARLPAPGTRHCACGPSR